MNTNRYIVEAVEDYSRTLIAATRPTIEVFPQQALCRALSKKLTGPQSSRREARNPVDRIPTLTADEALFAVMVLNRHWDSSPVARAATKALQAHYEASI